MRLHVNATILAALLLGLLGIAPAWAPAQDAPAAPADPMNDPAAGGAEDELGAGELEELLGMSQQDLEQVFVRAKLTQLQAERDEAIEEVRTSEAYQKDPKARQAAIALLTQGKGETAAANIELIARAFATADPRVRRIRTLLAEDKAEAAAQAARDLRNLEQSSYFNALVQHLYAEALVASDRPYRGVEAYRDLMVEMPQRLSFAAHAGIRAAEMFEKLKRYIYAQQMYQYCVEHYSLTLDKPTLDRMTERMTAIAARYEDPMGTVAKGMGEVAALLEKPELGDPTQQKQEEIVTLLSDLVKYMEERKQQRQKQQRQNQQRQQRQQQQAQGQGPGQSQGQTQGQGSKPGMPKGTQQPSSHARQSAVVPGAVARPTRLRRIRESAAGKWARLSPEERALLREADKAAAGGGRYADQSADYTAAISGEE